MSSKARARDAIALYTGVSFERMATRAKIADPIQLLQWNNGHNDAVPPQLVEADTRLDLCGKVSSPWNTVVAELIAVRVRVQSYNVSPVGEDEGARYFFQMVSERLRHIINKWRTSLPRIYNGAMETQEETQARYFKGIHEIRDNNRKGHRRVAVSSVS